MEQTPETVHQPIDSEGYLNTIRQAYQEEQIHYTGRRSEEQQTVAQLLSEEAEGFIDGGARLMAIGHPIGVEGDVAEYIGTELGEEYREKFLDMRGAFSQLYVAMGIASLRMERDDVHTSTGQTVHSLIELPDEDRKSILEQLFADFQDLNLLRYGAKGSGIPKKIFIEYDEYGAEVYHETDKDLKLNPRRLWQGMLAKKYREEIAEDDDSIPAVHVAGKMSPDEYRRLRKSYPDMQKDKFDTITGLSQNARQKLYKHYGR